MTTPNFSLRETAHDYIDRFDNAQLLAFLTLFSLPKNESPEAIEVVVDQNLTAAEKTASRKAFAEYQKHPETAISLDDYIAKRFPHRLPDIPVRLRHDSEKNKNTAAS